MTCMPFYRVFYYLPVLSKIPSRYITSSAYQITNGKGISPLLRTSGRARRALPSSGFWGQKKAGQPPSLWEIAISLNSGLNSARKFQTGVSNSGAQIPKLARQNSELPEITYFS